MISLIRGLFGGKSKTNNRFEKRNDGDQIWMEVKFHNPSDLPSSNWTILPTGSNLTVRGTSHRLADCLDFIRSSNTEDARLSILEGQHKGKRTLRIHGHHDKTDADGTFIGFVPAEMNAMLLEKFDPAMPIGARLISAAVTDDWKIASIRFHLVGPPKRNRGSYETGAN